MKAINCCQVEPEIELRYDMDEVIISCPTCNRTVESRNLSQCIREWNCIVGNTWNCRWKAPPIDGAVNQRHITIIDNT